MVAAGGVAVNFDTNGRQRYHDGMDGKQPVLRAGFLASVGAIYSACIVSWCWYLESIGETWDGIAISAIASPAIIIIMFRWVLTRMRGTMPEREQQAYAHAEESIAFRLFATIMPHAPARTLTQRLVFFEYPLSWIFFIITLVGLAALIGGVRNDPTILVFIPWAVIWCKPLESLLLAQASPATSFIGRLLLSGIVFALTAVLA